MAVILNTIGLDAPPDFPAGRYNECHALVERKRADHPGNTGNTGNTGTSNPLKQSRFVVVLWPFRLASGRASRDRPAEDLFEACDERGVAERPSGSLAGAQPGEGLFVARVGRDQSSKVGDAGKHRRNRHQFIVAARKMGAHAGPWPVLRARHQPRAYRIQADITYRRDQMRLVHCDRRETALEEMTAPAAARVDEGRIAAVRIAERPRKTCLIARRKHEMDVVGHQTICPDCDHGLSTMFGKKIAIDLLVARLEENGFAAITALRDVVRATGNDDAGETGHRQDISPSHRGRIAGLVVQRGANIFLCRSRVS